MSTQRAEDPRRCQKSIGNLARAGWYPHLNNDLHFEGKAMICADPSTYVQIGVLVANVLSYVQ